MLLLTKRRHGRSVFRLRMGKLPIENFFILNFQTGIRIINRQIFKVLEKNITQKCNEYKTVKN